MQVERHIFGSYSGYATLARSPGVSAEDARALESGAYGFGQSHDRSYLKSLSRQPAYFTRLLGGSRRGLTRILEGSPDDNNRPTLRLVTFIISQRDWDTILCGDINLLLEDKALAEWDGAPAIPAIDFTPGLSSRALPRKSLDKMLALVSETEKAMSARRALVVSASDYSLPELRALEMLIPPNARRQFTSACRSLSPQLPVNVNCLAAEAGSQGRGAYRYTAGADHFSPYAKFLAGTELGAGRIPAEAIASYRQFGAPEVVAPTNIPAMAGKNAMAAPPLARQHAAFLPLLITAVIGLSLAAGMFFIGKSTGSSKTLVAERALQEEQRQHYDALMADTLARETASHRDLLKKTLDVGGNSYEEALTLAFSKLQDSRNAAPTAARDSSAERDRLRLAYQGELGRQRKLFESLRREASTVLAEKKISAAAESSQALARIDGELAALSEDWPAAKEEDRKWIAEVKDTQERVRAAMAMLSVVGRVSLLLDECEGAMGSSGTAAMENIKANVEEAMDLVGHLPDKGETGGAQVGGIKAGSLARARKVKTWLAEQQKILHEAAEAEAIRDPRGVGKWWQELSPEKREEIKKNFDKNGTGASKGNP